MFINNRNGYVGEAKRISTELFLQFCEKWLIVAGTVAAGIYAIYELLKELCLI